MKKSLVLACLLAIGANSFATEIKDGWFVGLQTGSASYRNKATANLIDVVEYNKATDGYISFKVGKYFDYGRVYLNYNIYDTKSNVDMKYFEAGYDYLFYNSTKFTPYIGVNAGYSVAKNTGALKYGYNKDELDLSGFAYGLGIGAMYKINDSFDIEVSASYNKLDADDTLNHSSGLSVYYEANYITHLGIGFNYNF